MENAELGWMLRCIVCKYHLSLAATLLVESPASGNTRTVHQGLYKFGFSGHAAAYKSKITTEQRQASAGVAKSLSLLGSGVVEIHSLINHSLFTIWQSDKRISDWRGNLNLTERATHIPNLPRMHIASCKAWWRWNKNSVGLLLSRSC